MRQLLLAQEYWRVKGLRADVVILNEHPADYLDEMQRQLAGAASKSRRWAGWLDKPGGMFLLRSDGMPEADRRLLSAVARVVLRGDLGELAPQLDRPAPVAVRRHDDRACRRHPAAPRARQSSRLTVPPLVMENGLGGFTPDGREYVVVARRRPGDAAAVVERAGEPGVRHDASAAVGRRLHVGGATAARTG